MLFLEKLRLLMKQNGQTTRSLGDRVGVSSAAVTGWVNGARPRPAVAAQLAEFFGIDVDDLLDDTRELPSGKHGLRVEEPPAPYGRRVIAADPSYPSGARQHDQLPAQLASLSAELAQLSAKLYSGEPPANLRERLRAAGEKLHRIADQH